MRTVLTFFLLQITFQVIGQTKSIGSYHVSNFSINDIELLAPTNSIVQSQNGIMYFGNNKGISIFDGKNWHLITLPNNSAVWVLKPDLNGTIFVGAMDEFGFLKTLPNGTLIYESLSQKLDKSYREFGNVTGIYPFSDGILFVCNSIITYYNRQEFKILASGGNYFQTFQKNDSILINNGNQIFQIFYKGKFFNYAASEHLECENTSAIISWNKSNILAINNKKGCFEIINEECQLVQTAFSDFVLKNKIISSLELKNGFTALGSLHNGALIIDSEGNKIQHINKNNGLENNRVISIYEDKLGNLWIGHDLGVSHVEISSPLTYLVPKGMGSGFAARVFDNKLYLGTSHELFFIPWDTKENLQPDQLKRHTIEHIYGQVWKLNEIENNLYASSNAGTYLINEHSATRIDLRPGTWEIKPYSQKRGIYLQGTYTSMAVYGLINGKLEYKNHIENFSKPGRIFEIDNKDNIWVTHGYEGVFKLQTDQQLTKCTALKFYGKQNGFPSNLGINTFTIKNKILFTSEHGGIYEYNASQDSFLLNTEFEEFFGKYPKLSKLYEDYDGNIWFVELERTGVLINNGNNRYKLIDKPFSGLHKSQIRGFELIYPIDNKNVILGTNYGFLHYDPEIQKNYNMPYNAVVRKVEFIGIKDSLVYGGFKPQNKLENNYIFRNKHNSLRFNYIAPFYEGTENLKYTCYLEGFDKGWSEWSNKTEREYTNLPGGTYTFRVKAKNIYNNESVEDTFHFYIKPHFANTWVAYIIYILGFISLVLALVYFYSKKKVTKYRKAALVKEKEIIYLKNQQLNADIEFKNKELGSMTMQIIKRNEMLLNIKNKLDENYSKFNPEVINAVDLIIKSIENEVNAEKDWEFIQINFDSVYKGFLKKLKELFPELKASELQLCAYIRMGLSNKEIATLMNSTYRGVEGYRYRLRKNLNLEHDENIKDFLFNLLD